MQAEPSEPSPEPVDGQDAPQGDSLDDLFQSDDGSAIGELIGAKDIGDQLTDGLIWLKANLWSLDSGMQMAIILAALVPAAMFGPQIKKLITTQIAPRAPYGGLRRAANAFAHIATPIALFLIWQIAAVSLGALDRTNAIIEAAVSLLSAWIVIRMVTLVIRSPFWSKAAFYMVWPIAALDAGGILDDVIRQLDRISIPLGEAENGQAMDFSALDAIRTLVIFIALFWVANFISRFLKSRISAVDELTPSLQALLIKILDILMPIVAFLMALQIVGFNFATLAIFGGAVGLGIGLGLQSTISNFFAGFTLIADKSIKPGDVVEVGESFGWVTEMNARYVTIRTRDGKSHLIPNDKFIDEGVINWSHSDRIVRLHAQFGVSYAQTDLRAVKKAAEETAVTVDRVLKSPSPMCNLVEFGDNSVNFDLRFWINDPANGVSNVTSLVMLALWERLLQMGVEIPFPQRDIHIKSLPDGFRMTSDATPDA
jgi:small-conductance mechanosensitive channel